MAVLMLPLAGRLEFKREGGMVLGVEKMQASLQKSKRGLSWRVLLIN
jgi:hypothetical protein